MASWLVATPGKKINSRIQRQYIQEQIEAQPALHPATIEMIAALPTPTKTATPTKLNLTSIKSRVNTNERSHTNIIC